MVRYLKIVTLYFLFTAISLIFSSTDASTRRGYITEGQAISPTTGEHQHNIYNQHISDSTENAQKVYIYRKTSHGNITRRTTSRITSKNAQYTATKDRVFDFKDNGNNKSLKTTTSAVLSKTFLGNNNGCVERRLDLRTIMFIILLVCVFIVAIVSNGLAIFVILASRSLRRHPTNLLVASLNFCDIGVILCSLPIRLDGIVYNRFCFDIHVCRFFNATDFLFHISSISHLFVIAIERCVAVRAPFFHRYTLTSQRILQVVGVTWLYSAVWAGLSMFDWEKPDTITDTSKIIFTLSKDGLKRSCILNNRLYLITVYIVIYLVPLIIMAVMYVLILRAVTKHQARMNLNTTTTANKERSSSRSSITNTTNSTLQNYGKERSYSRASITKTNSTFTTEQNYGKERSYSRVSISTTTSAIMPNSTRKTSQAGQHQPKKKERSWSRISRLSIISRRHKKHKRTEENLNKTVAIIYGTFVICWLPVTIITIVYQLCQVCFEPFMKGSPVVFEATVTLFVVVLPNIHSCLNPFIYIIFHRTFRTAVQELICRHLGKKSDDNKTSMRPSQYKSAYKASIIAVSYTHLTLPTILLV